MNKEKEFERAFRWIDSWDFFDRWMVEAFLKERDKRKLTRVVTQLKENEWPTWSVFFSPKEDEERDWLLANERWLFDHQFELYVLDHKKGDLPLVLLGVNEKGAGFGEKYWLPLYHKMLDGKIAEAPLRQAIKEKYPFMNKVDWDKLLFFPSYQELYAHLYEDPAYVTELILNLRESPELVLSGKDWLLKDVYTVEFDGEIVLIVGY